jgi:hypothetical protein
VAIALIIGRFTSGNCIVQVNFAAAAGGDAGGGAGGGPGGGRRGAQALVRSS